MNISSNIARPAVKALPAPEPKKFDLTEIDTPEEAYLMPVADLLVSMAAGQAQDGDAEVTVTAGGQTFSYQTSESAVTGNINGEDFRMDAQIDPEAGTVSMGTELTSGALSTNLGPVPGGIQISGQAGTISYEQNMVLDPMAALTGHVGDITGNIGGLELNQSLNMSQDGSGMIITGNLGDSAISQTVSEGPNGTVVIEGTIGDLKVRRELVK